MKKVHRGAVGLSDEGYRLRQIAKSVIDVPRRNRQLPLLDQLAVALILDRREFLPNGEFTILQAVERLGEKQVRVAIAVERSLMADSDDENI